MFKITFFLGLISISAFTYTMKRAPEQEEYAIEKKMKLNIDPKEMDNAIKAISEGSLIKIAQLLKDGFNINAPINIEGDTMLHRFARTKHNCAALKYLLRHGADSTQKNRVGDTALDVAIKSNKHKAIAILFEFGEAELPLDFFSKKNIEQAFAVLNFAVKNNLLRVIKIYHQNNYDFSYAPPGVLSLLSVACQYNCNKSLALLLELAEFSQEDINEAFGYAVIYNKPIVKLLLEKGAEINAIIDNEGVSRTPIYYAIDNNCIETLTILLSCGAKLKDKEFLLALRRGNKKIISLLMPYMGLRICQAHCEGQRAIDYAIEWGDKELIDLLVKNGYKFICDEESEIIDDLDDEEIERFEDLMNSILANDIPRVKSLIPQTKHKPHNYCVNEFVINPFCLACLMGNIEIVTEYLKYKHDLNDSLFWAIEGNNKEIFDLLIKAGAADQSFLTTYHNPLQKALVKKNLYFVEQCFLANKKMLKLRIPGSREVINYALKNNELISLLLKSGAKVPKSISGFPINVMNTCIAHGSTVDDYEMTLNSSNYQIGYLSKEPEVQSYLKNPKEDILNKVYRKSIKYHQCPLMWASIFGHIDVIKILIHEYDKQIKETGTSTFTFDYQDKEGKTPLIYSIERENEEITKLLLEKNEKGNRISNPYNIDVNYQDSAGNTALVYAAQKGNFAIVKLLIACNAQVTAKALRGATLSGNNQLVLYLLMAGAKTYGVLFKDNVPYKKSINDLLPIIFE